MQIEFNQCSKINSKQAGVISDLIRKKYKKDTLIKEYIKNKEIKKCSKVMLPIGDIDLLDVFRNVDTIFDLSGEKTIFSEMTKKLEDKIADAESFVNTHKYEECLLSVYYWWIEIADKWIEDPHKNFHERMDAITSINRALKHNVFDSKEVELLCKMLTFNNQ